MRRTEKTKARNRRKVKETANSCCSEALLGFIIGIAIVVIADSE